MSSSSTNDLPNDLWHPCVHRWEALNQLENDAQYFDGLRAIELVRERIFSLQNVPKREVYNPNLNESFAQPQLDFFQNGRLLQTQLETKLQSLEAKRQQLLQVASSNSFVPLIERFLSKMNASEAERRLFLFVVMSASNALSEYDPNGMPDIYGDSRLAVVTSLDAFYRCALTLTEFLQWTQLESPWVLQRVYEVCERPNSGNVSALSNSTLRLFMGLPLTNEKQYLELESSVLQECLLETPVFCQSQVGRAILEEQQDRADSRQESPVYNELAQELMASSSSNNNNVPHAMGDGKLFRIIGEMQERALEASAAADAQLSLEQQDVGDNNVVVESEDDDLEVNEQSVGPYRSELDYLQDQFILIDLEVKLQKLSTEMTDEEFETGQTDSFGYALNNPRTKDEVQQRNQREADKIEIKVKKLKERIGSRVRATKVQRKMLPRLEQLSDALKLDRFERFVVLNLIRDTIDPKPFNMQKMARLGIGADKNYVEFFISTFSRSLEVKMRCRKCFYKSSTLVQEGILTISGQEFSSDLNRCSVFIDKRLVDYLCGVDMELSEMVDGSHLYTPDVSMDDVVLPSELKNRILDVALNYEAVKEKYKELAIDKKITYGLGQILLFYGASGVGKTMTANAIACKLKKKVLLVNFPSLGLNSPGDIIKMLFREARIKKAIIFFDECESIFRSRDLGDSAVNTCLTELERFDDMCILATNKPQFLDDAMYRRISLAVEFRKPDLILREKIWETLRPEKLNVDKDVDYKELARKFELSGGFIKNVWLSAVSLMVSRQGDSVSLKDLETAAREQLVGSVKNEDLDRHVIPTCGIESIIASEDVSKALKDIVDHKKAQSVLFSQWGFDKLHRNQSGVSALFHGPPGTGKTMAAEALSFDIGCPLMVVNAAELLNAYVGQTGKNIVAVFKDAKQKEAVLVFDEAEALFGSRNVASGSSLSRHDNLNVGLLLQNIESYNGICIVITNHREAIDEAFFRRFTYVLQFEPGPRQREKLWKSIVPEDCPVAADVSYSNLANRYEMCGGDIKSSLLRAASRAALRSEKDRLVRMGDLEKACQEEVTKRSSSGDSKNIYL